VGGQRWVRLITAMNLCARMVRTRGAD